MTTQAVDEFAPAFEGASAGYVHAVDLRSGVEIGHGADEPVVLASVFKVPVLVELFRQADQGRLQFTEQVTVPVAGRTEGPFGLSVMRDPATMSWRDLAWLMMSLSDNEATDVICDRIGIDSVNDALRDLGLFQTVLVGNCRDLFQSVSVDLGLPADTDLDAIDVTDPAVADRLRLVDPLSTSRSTPRELTALLGLIWADQAASADSCAAMRRILGQQVWPHRLAAGFPEDDVSTSGKTGTLPLWRNEAGVVEYPDGGRYAVAVFLRSRRHTQKDPAADSAIARSARVAVDALREITRATAQPGGPPSSM